MTNVNDFDIRSYHRTVPSYHPDLKPEKVKEVIIHNMGAMPWPTPTREQASLEKIQSWTHDNYPEIKYIAYNVLVWDDGSFEIGRGHKIGAHCLNNNSKSLGIAWVGDGSQTAPSQAAQDAIVALARRYKAELFPGIESVVPHWMRFDTECCGRKFSVTEIAQRILAAEPGLTDWEKNVRSKIDNIAAHTGIISTPEYWYHIQYTPQTRSDFVERLILNVSGTVDIYERRIAELEARIKEMSK